jgi:nucleoid-associated protein YgaU
MLPKRKRKFTLMPLIALAGLCLAVTLPVLSSTAIHAAPVTHMAVVTVESGDTLWALASAHTAKGDDVQANVDRIIAINKLDPASGLTIGQKLRIPE